MQIPCGGLWGIDLIGQNNICNMALDYTINDGGTNDYIYEADNETTGCLEGILQHVKSGMRRKNHEWEELFIQAILMKISA